MTFKFKVAAVALAISAVGAAHAQKAPVPDYTLSAYVGAVNDYRFRGIEQTGATPALQAGADFAHKNGFYAGVFTSSVTWVREFNGASAGEREVDYFLGFKTSVSNIGLDIGAIQYQYPGNNSGATGTQGAGLYADANTTEVYAGVSFGVASFKLFQSTSNYMGFLNSSGTKYYDLSFNVDLGNGLTFVPHVGKLTIANINNGDYTDYSLTLNKDFGKGWSGSLAYVGNNANATFYTAGYNGAVNKNLASPGGVLGVKYTF